MIKIISFVDSFKHFEIPINEYLKRLQKEVFLMKLKPVNKGSTREIVKAETQILKETLAKTKGYKVLLYIDSKEFDSMGFSDFIEKNRDLYSDVVFIIGGAYGVDFDMIKDQIDFKLSLSPMTFPHIMAIMILLEQIYRGLSIKKGSEYHH
ncbi:MAG: 23S rRNA (pseudouridine(1915)-N(3))-methyltransferase RlmH [Candidatus Gracilibacteria bacterium]|nr:23S rRNA (pseudouridine(1915)-N(3))-methyltransferase RlmH [Candidatus Gracilibacteria bacterium]